MTGSFSHHAANKKEPARSLKRVWRLYAGLGIHSFPHSLFALLLKIAHFQELPWAIHSHHSLQKSELLFKKEWCEWFACDSSESLAKNERIARKERANCLQRMSESLEKFVFLYVFDKFSPFYAQEQIATTDHWLFFRERLEGFAPVAFYKRATMSDCLRSLMTKERREPFTLFH